METDYHAIGVRLIPKLHLNKVYYHSDIDSSYRITYINELAIFDNEGWQIGSFAESASLLTTRTHSHVNWCALLFNRISLVYLLFYLKILNRKPLFSWLYCFFSFESVHTLIALRSASVALRKFL